ncbi:MAG: DUF2007 domain-containing protein [Akkermansiaceae bacterium]|nr:DUF2007 domain-containing protein [Akkermansiaceae bacterium]
MLQDLVAQLFLALMVILRKYTMLMQAELAKLELASYGIEATILDENLGSIAPHLTLLNGVRLAVADQDEQDAEGIINAMTKRNTAQ